MKIKNLYIPNWVYTSEQKHQVKKSIGLKDLEYFDWLIEIDKEQKEKNTIVMLLQNLQDQILNYFTKIKKDTKVNIFINSFSQIVFLNVYDEIKDKINKIILLNPLDSSLYLKVLTLKRNMLPQNSHDAINKYIYLCKSIKNMRNDELWLNDLRNEPKMFINFNIIYHKIFDQILNYAAISNYLRELNNIVEQENCFVIIGRDNPLMNLRKKKSLFNKLSERYFLIDECGYCIWWEQPEELLKIVKTIMK